MFSGLPWRIAIAYVGLMTLVLLALGVYLVGWQRAQQVETLAAHLERQARLVADGARQPLADGDTAGLDALAKRLKRESGARITLIAADGRVWGDSDGDAAQMENLAARPEVRQALETGGGQIERRGVALDDDLLYVAVPIESGGTVLGVARVALPVQEAEAAANRVAAVIVGTLALAALLAIALAIVLARVMTRRIEALSRAVRRLAGGELEKHGRHIRLQRRPGLRSRRRIAAEFLDETSGFHTQGVELRGAQPCDHPLIDVRRRLEQRCMHPQQQCGVLRRIAGPCRKRPRVDWKRSVDGPVDSSDA